MAQSRNSERNRRKAEEELFWFHVAQDRCASIPRGEARSAEAGRDPPDILLDTATGTIGVEVVRYFADTKKHPSIVSPDSKAFHDFVEQEAAKRISESIGAFSVHFTLHWQATPAKVRGGPKKLIDAIVDLAVSRIRSQADSDYWCFGWDDFPDGVLQDTVDSFTATRLPAGIPPSAPAMDSGWVFPDVAGLQCTITGKDELAADCGKVTPHGTALLVVAPGGGRFSATLHEIPTLQSHSYTSEFDRVFVLDAASGKCFEASITRPRRPADGSV